MHKKGLYYFKEVDIQFSGLSARETLNRSAWIAAGATLVFFLCSCLQPILTTSDYCDPADLNAMLKDCREDSIRACRKLTVMQEVSRDTLLSGKFDDLWPLSPVLFNKSRGGISITGFNQKGKRVFHAVVNPECATDRTIFPIASHFSSETVDGLLLEKDTLEIYPWDTPLKMDYEPASLNNSVHSASPQDAGEIFSVTFFLNDKVLIRYSPDQTKVSMYAFISYGGLALDQVNTLRIEVGEEEQPKKDHLFYIKLGCVPNGRCFDSLALLALQDSMPNIRFSDKKKPLDKWQGIEIKDNRVVKIDLGSDKEKMGGFPAEMAYLSGLETLTIHSRHSFPGIVLPREIGDLHNLKTLQLPNFKLTRLPLEIGGLKNLRVLELYLDSLSRAIYELEGLLELRVRHLAHLPKEIQNLKNLQVLDLKQHVLQVLPLELSGLHELKELRLSGVNMPGYFGDYSILDILYGLHKLEILVLRRINLSPSFEGWGPEYIEYMADYTRLRENSWQSSLKVLDLAYTQLEYLPENIFENSALEELNLRGNRLTILPREIGNLKKIRSLNLAANHIYLLPPELGELPLQELILSKNQLSVIPSEMLALSRLHELDVDGNRLCELPDTMRNWVNLTSSNRNWLNSQQCQSPPLSLDRILDSIAVKALYQFSGKDNKFVGEWLFYEPLSTWPGISVENDRVTGIEMEDKSVAFIPPEIKYLTKLETLQIRLRFLNTVPRAISELANLKSLTLEHLENRNPFVVPESMGNLLQLETFIAHPCESLPPDIGKLLHLKHLDLSNGALSELPLEITALTPTDFFSVNGNRLCDVPDTVKSWISTYSTDENWMTTQTCN